tara:strand:+ start:2066 stop:3391 length:1326 start_codon:yes stop_codon:yes gene_type:complete
MNFLNLCRKHKSISRFSLILVILGLVAVSATAATAQDFEAVEKRLAKGVVKGELSLQQAAAMMEMLHDIAEDGDEEDEDFRAAMKDELENVGAELRNAVMRGEMSEKEAWRAWGEFKESEFAPQLKRAVREGMMSEKEAWMWWKGIEKAEMAERLKSSVMKGEMTEEEARQKWKKMERSGKKNRKRGHHKHHHHHKDHRGHDHPHKKGHHDKHDDGDHKHDDGHHHHKDHHEDHHGDHQDRGSDREMAEKARAALEDAGFTADQMRMARGVIMRMAFAMKAAGDDYEMNPRMQSFLEEKANLSDEQIDLLESLARRVVEKMPENAAKWAEKMQKRRDRMEKMREKIEAAVGNGELTREEADAKYQKMREKMMKARRDGRASNPSPTPAQATEVPTDDANNTQLGEQSVDGDMPAAETTGGATSEEISEALEDQDTAIAEKS